MIVRRKDRIIVLGITGKQGAFWTEKMIAYGTNVVAGVNPKRVGVISRSGSLGTLVCLNVTRAGLGQSAFIGIGGDPMLGTTTRDALEALDKDTGTDAIVIVGEIGGAMEESAADYAKQMRKPV